jgi:hypothetical protein
MQTSCSMVSRPSRSCAWRQACCGGCSSSSPAPVAGSKLRLRPRCHRPTPPDWLERVYPSPEAKTSATAMIQANFQSTGPNQTVRLLLEGTDVTSYATIRRGQLHYDPDDGRRWSSLIRGRTLRRSSSSTCLPMGSSRRSLTATNGASRSSEGQCPTSDLACRGDHWRPQASGAGREPVGDWTAPRAQLPGDFGSSSASRSRPCGLTRHRGPPGR